MPPRSISDSQVGKWKKITRPRKALGDYDREYPTMVGERVVHDDDNQLRDYMRVNLRLSVNIIWTKFIYRISMAIELIITLE